MEEIIQEALSKGVEMHVAGEFDLAGQLYESVIKLQRNHADANHNMGLLKLDMGNDLEALPYLQTALQADTTIAQFWLSYIKALIKLERLDEATRILDLAKESGFEGGEFAELNQLINTPDESTPVTETVADVSSPPQEILNQLINLYNQGKINEAVEQAEEIIGHYPHAFMAWNILGAANKSLAKGQEATKAFKKVTELRPEYADGFNNLGLALQDEGKLDEAIKAYEKVLVLQPNDSETYCNIGNVLQEQGVFENAVTAYNKALSLKPKYAEAYYNMGYTYKKMGRLEEAIEAHKSAISIKPDFAEAHYNLGNSLKEQGKLTEAIEAIKKAIQLKPNYAIAYNSLASTLKDQGKTKEALVAYHKALAIKPDYAAAYNNMGITLDKQGKLDEAIDAYHKALAIEPDYAAAYNNMGLTLNKQGKLDEAIDAYNKALSIKPDFAEAYNNLGMAFKDCGHLEQALEAYIKAVTLKPNSAEAYDNMGRLYWLNHDFIKAYELMEWRWKSKKQNFIGIEFNSDKPKWNGEHKKKVFVWKEQGIGDEIMFSSILNELNNKSTKLIIECDKRLIPLYKRSFPKNVKIVEDRNNILQHEYDAHIPNASLLKHFRQNIKDFEKVSAGWLKADIRKSATFQKVLHEQGNDKIIGISWFTKSKKSTSHRRNVPIKLLANCLQKLPAKYINLQYGLAAEEVSSISSKYGIHLKYIEELDLFDDLDGLAALISACDLVISVDNTTVHMAGALGIDTRVLLPLTADERWGLKSSNSYWYDSVTLYRQEILDDWSKPLERLIIDLKNMHLQKC